MDALVINLDRRPDRLSAFLADMQRIGQPVQRVPGRTDFEVVQHCAFEAHRDCWRIVAGRSDPVLVFEDDCVVCTDFHELLRKVMGHLPPGWGLLNLHHTKCGFTAINDHIGRSHYPGWGSHAYVLKPTAAGQLLTGECDREIDYYLTFACYATVGVVPYVTTQNMVWQRGWDSDNPMSDQSVFWAEQFAEEFF
jgi:hypothetical protein